jgi:hypothetical protein
MTPKQLKETADEDAGQKCKRPQLRIQIQDLELGKKILACDRRAAGELFISTYSKGVCMDVTHTSASENIYHAI